MVSTIGWWTPSEEGLRWRVVYAGSGRKMRSAGSWGRPGRRAFSVSQVGRRYDVNANLIFKWRRDPRYRPAGDGEGAPSFLPVEVVPEPLLPPSAAPATSDGRIEIVLVGGHRVSASGSFDVDALCRVVRALVG